MKRNFFKAFSVFFIFFILIFSVCVNAGLDNITEKESKNSESLQENAEQNSEGIDEILQNTENTEEQIQNETAEEKITQEENILDIPSENPKLNEENETTIEDINEESSPEYINLEEILNSTKQISEKNNKTIENETQEKEILNESLNDMLPENDVGQLPASSTDSDSNKDANENPKEIKIVNLNPDENAEYIDLDEINGINKENENNSGEYEEEIEEIIPHTSYDSGKKEIEIETYESFDIASIEKIEIEKSELKKEVIVFSEEHIEEELRIYSDLPQEAKKENIKIHWKNEMIELVEDGNYGVEYYDENENGLIDRVSWIVPHLSTQNFEIEIVVETEKKSDSAEIEISVNDAPSGEVEMPINFNFSINYNQEVNCSLWVEIDNYQGILDRESYKGSIDEPKIDYFNFVDEENLLL